MSAARTPDGKRTPTGADRAVGGRLRRARRDAGLTLRMLARAVGLSAVQLQRYEVGTSRIAAGRLLGLAAALGVAPETLLGREGEGSAGEDARELARVFSGIADPAHRAAIMGLVRAVAAEARR